MHNYVDIQYLIGEQCGHWHKDNIQSGEDQGT